MDIGTTEIRLIRWGVKILTPLLTAGLLAVVTYMFGIGNTLAELTAKQDNYKNSTITLKQSVDKLSKKTDDQLESQHTVEVQVERIETHQEHFKQEIKDIKNQNAEIIRLLRENTR